MKDENIVFVGNSLNDLDDCIDEYCQGMQYQCAHYVVSGYQFCLLCNVEMTRFVLYVRRDYIEKNGKLYYTDLHAVKSYSSYQDCMDNLNADIDYWVYGELEEMEV